MKTLYEFILNRKDITDTGTVETPFKYAILKPTREIKEKAEIFYAVSMSDLIQKGVITKQLLVKRISNDGGAISEDNKKELIELIAKLKELEDKDSAFTSKPLDTLTKEEAEEKAKILEEKAKINVYLNEFYVSQAQLFQHTAEAMAENKLLTWWILELSLKDVGQGKYEKVFAGADFKERLNTYDELIEKGDKFFTEEVVPSFVKLINVWFFSGIKDKDSFDKILNE